MKRIKRLFLALILCLTTISFAQDGTLDTTFDIDGKVTTLFETNLSNINHLVVQPDGKIIAGGTVFATSSIYSQFALARYNQDGSLDDTFGVGGKAASDFLDLHLELSAIAIQSDGKIVAVGTSHTFFTGLPYEHFEIIRFKTNGTIDKTFGVNGRVLPTTFGDVNNMAAVIIQSDGSIIVGGDTLTYSNPADSDFVMLRYLNNGVLDTSFGHNGIVITSLQADDVAKAITLQDDGKILLAGSSRAVYDPIVGYYAQDFAVVRYNNDGSLDTTFGTNGKFLAEGNEEFDTALLVKSQADGIIVAGSALPTGAANNFMVMHLLPKGKLDPDFGTGGVVIKPLSFGEVTAMEMQPDGKLLLAQYHGTGGTSSADIQLMRFLATGDPDLTFGEDGIVTTDFINQNSQAHTIAVQSDGKILIGGGSGNPIHVDFAVSRFNSTLKLANSEFSMESFSVYPNPVKQIVNLTFTLKEPQQLSIDLYDTGGKRIANLLNEKTFDSGNNIQKLELPSTLSGGVYFLNISDGSHKSGVKIVKE